MTTLQQVSKCRNEEKIQSLGLYSVDLTKEAEEGKLDPVIGREKEIERIIHILARRKKNNVILIGPTGVGKNEVVNGLAQRIVSKNVPKSFENKKIIAVDLPALVAGAGVRGEFEKRLKMFLKEIKEADGDIFTFIDEIHVIRGAGALEGALDAANILKPALAKGELRCIGATTFNEYKKYIESDPALVRRFMKVRVDEPSIDDTISILRGVKRRYEADHKVKIQDSALIAAAKLSDRYITDKYLPDKAIDLVEEASVKVKLEKERDSNKALKALKAENNVLKAEEKNALKSGDFERASEIRYGLLPENTKKIDDLSSKTTEINKKKTRIKEAVDEEEIALVVSNITGIPVSRLHHKEKEKLLNMEEELAKRIIGQDLAVSAVSNTIKRARAGIQDPKRPQGVFFLIGPTGVGKTEIVKALAEFLFNDEDAIVRIDMSEYQESYFVSRLIGSPPGLVGYEEGGQLTEAIKHNPYSIILFDEIEKAHPDVFNTLLPIFDNGRLTDGKGCTVDFKNTIIIMTSNIGSQIIAEAKGDITRVEKELNKALKMHFRPEFLNRIDEVIVFNSLTLKDVLKIVELQLDELRRRLKDKKFAMEVTDDAIKALATLGYDPVYGARPIKRCIQQHIENPLADKILEEKFKEGDTIYINSNNKGKFIFSKTNKVSREGQNERQTFNTRGGVRHSENKHVHALQNGSKKKNSL